MEAGMAGMWPIMPSGGARPGYDLVPGITSLEQLSGTLLAFVDRYNKTAKPFNWKYTAADLTDLLRRITEHEQAAATHQPDLTTAA